MRRSVSLAAGDVRGRADRRPDRREQERRVRAHAAGADRRRADRRGTEPSSWSSLDFLVSQAVHDPVAHLSVTPLDGDLLVLRETNANGPCPVSTVPGPAHLLLPSYKEAVAYALRRVPVDVWYTEDHMAFTAVRRARVHPTTS
jgi:hypothetical protein